MSLLDNTSITHTISIATRKPKGTIGISKMMSTVF